MYCKETSVHVCTRKIYQNGPFMHSSVSCTVMYGVITQYKFMQLAHLIHIIRNVAFLPLALSTYTILQLPNDRISRIC